MKSILQTIVLYILTLTGGLWAAYEYVYGTTLSAVCLLIAFLFLEFALVMVFEFGAKSIFAIWTVEDGEESL